MADAVTLAIEHIRSRGTCRTPELAAELGIGEAAVDAMLEPARASGVLTSCAVQVGERRSIEYRCSATGGSYSPHMGITPLRRAAPQQPFLPPRTTTREEPQVSVRDKIEAVLREHGPMGTRAMKKHIGVTNLSTIAGQLLRMRVLRKLGGGPKSTIYGLPGQEAPKADALEAGAELGRKSAPPARKKRAGGGSAAMRRKRVMKKAAKKAWATRRANGAKKAAAFRPALAADGAILLLGAAGGDFEITREEARTVVSLARRLSGGELAVLRSFIERLDGAAVAA